MLVFSGRGFLCVHCRTLRVLSAGAEAGGGAGAGGGAQHGRRPRGRGWASEVWTGRGGLPTLWTSVSRPNPREVGGSGCNINAAWFPRGQNKAGPRARGQRRAWNARWTPVLFPWEPQRWEKREVVVSGSPLSEPPHRCWTWSLILECQMFQARQECFLLHRMDRACSELENGNGSKGVCFDT